MKKPRLGQTIYYIYWGEIHKDYVYALSRDSFIIAQYGPALVSAVWEWSFDMYGVDWFTNLAEAKKFLLEKTREECPDEKVKIKQMADDWWRIEY